MNIIYNRSKLIYFTVPKNADFDKCTLVNREPWLVCLREEEGTYYREFLGVVDETSSPVGDLYKYSLEVNTPVDGKTDYLETYIRSLKKEEDRSKEQSTRMLMENSAFFKNTEFEITDTTISFGLPTASTETILQQIQIEHVAQMNENQDDFTTKLNDLRSECRRWKDLYNEKTKEYNESVQLYMEEAEQVRQMNIDNIALTTKMNKKNEEYNKLVKKYDKLKKTQSQCEQDLAKAKAQVKDVKEQIKQMKESNKISKKAYKSLKKMQNGEVNMTAIGRALKLAEVVLDEDPCNVEKALAIWRMNPDVKLSNIKEIYNIYEHLSKNANEDEMKFETLKEFVEHLLKANTNVDKYLQKYTVEEFENRIYRVLFQPFIKRYESEDWKDALAAFTCTANDLENEGQVRAYVEVVATQRWLQSPAPNNDFKNNVLDFRDQYAYRLAWDNKIDLWARTANWGVENCKGIVGDPLEDSPKEVMYVTMWVNVVNVLDQSKILKLNVPKTMPVWQFAFRAQQLLNGDSFLLDAENQVIAQNETMKKHPKVYMCWS